MNTTIKAGATSLKESLTIQRRVIFALAMREMITRFGRHNIGFLWLFVEPMIFTLGITTLWTVAKSVHGSNLPIVSFALTGYSSVLLWRNSANRCARAVEANAALLSHRNVKIIDVLLARIIIEVSGATLSFTVLGLTYTAIGIMEPPANFPVLLEGWVLLIWMAAGVALIVGALSEESEVFDRLWHAFTYLLFGIAGGGFLVDWLPESVQKVVLYLPMVHGTEMLRHGFYGDAIRTYEDPTYLITCNIIFTFIGLFWVKNFSKRYNPE